MLNGLMRRALRANDSRTLLPTVSPLMTALEVRGFNVASEVTDEDGIFFVHYGIRRVSTSVSIGVELMGSPGAYILDLDIPLNHDAGTISIAPEERIETPDYDQTFREEVVPRVLEALDYYLQNTGVSEYYPLRTE